ncbi:copper-binding protein [uncultured Aquimonas sp.]|uniref:copper-binding protein n=1 Tax=uncultured Aquimonas sp. TaxID=385483 RepID=UPI002604F173|nr:copper-binding protein [uncultured Aquimonas sp.]
MREVDNDAKKLTIKHRHFKSLDMPPMTTVFQVKDTAPLDTVDPGDKVRFLVEKAASGFVVTDVQAAK